MKKSICSKIYAALLICLVMPIAADAQTFNSILNFEITNGEFPKNVSLVQGTDGNFYGTTSDGGAFNSGTVFKLTRKGLTTLYSFCSQANCADGALPYAGLALGTDGNLYGTTDNGGTGNACFENCGTVFKITPTGALTTLHSFNQNDGANPIAALVQGTDGNFYGTTSSGGQGVGTVFKITREGSFTTVYNFVPPANPTGTLIQANDGNFYGTTGGGAHNGGTVFRVSPQGTLSTVYNFCAKASCADGAGPNSPLVQTSDGSFYGTTQGGGSSNNSGTVFKLTGNGVLTTLYSFCVQTPCPDGAIPVAGLVLGTDGNFYGTTFTGGVRGGNGTLFRITPSGVLTTLHSFAKVDGYQMWGGLVQATDGFFYGTPSEGGDLNCSAPTGCGTIFSLSMGFESFVSFVNNPTKAGQMFGVLGQGFTGTTNVSLNGTSVPFTINSDTLITATVPVGGTSGVVTVTTPTGTLTSNVPFRVLPQLLSFTPTNGPMGTQVTITGVSLTQANGVGFGNTIPGQFTVNSDTQVTATVPSGAKTGPVGIQTQGGIAISTQTFTVTQ